MDALLDDLLQGPAVAAWRSFSRGHAAIVRVLDAELAAEHGITTRDFQVLFWLSQSPEGQLPMSALAERTMLTRSGITRLVDGLVEAGLIERVACIRDARISYAQLTPSGDDLLRRAAATHVARVNELFGERFSFDELENLAELLGRLPGADPDGQRPTE